MRRIRALAGDLGPRLALVPSAKTWEVNLEVQDLCLEGEEETW